MKMNKENFKKVLPVLTNLHSEPHIELISNREATIEGCHGIVEYNDSIATVNCNMFLISFEGFDISLNSLSDNCITVKGQFSAITYSLL